MLYWCMQSQHEKMYPHHTDVDLQLVWEDWQTWIHDRVQTFQQEPGPQSEMCTFVLVY